MLGSGRKKYNFKYGKCVRRYRAKKDRRQGDGLVNIWGVNRRGGDLGEKRGTPTNFLGERRRASKEGGSGTQRRNSSGWLKETVKGKKEGGDLLLEGRSMQKGGK